MPLHDIITSVKQLIARIDPELHVRLKARAAAEGRSVNSLVTELLRLGLEESDARAQVRVRTEVAGLQVVPPRPTRVPSRDAAVRSTRGAGTVASEALEADRSSR
jgi:antitoxin FitA